MKHITYIEHSLFASRTLLIVTGILKRDRLSYKAILQKFNLKDITQIKMSLSLDKVYIVFK